MKQSRKKIAILGVPIDSFSRSECLKYIEKKISDSKPLLITTVNVEFLYQALYNKKVYKMLQNSSLNLADGIGVIWAAKYLSLALPADRFARTLVGVIKLIGSLAAIIFYPGYFREPIPERISGSDFIWELSYFAAKGGLKVFLLGGQPTIPEQAALRLQTEVYGLNVSGTYEGSPNPDEEKKIISLVKKNSTDILFVAYGVPNEEFWLERNLSKTGAKIGIGVGGTFDFLAGRIKRAPNFVQTIGLEWLWRLIRQPRRFHRQLSLPKFVVKIFREKISNSS